VDNQLRALLVLHSIVFQHIFSKIFLVNQFESSKNIRPIFSIPETQIGQGFLKIVTLELLKLLNFLSTDRWNALQ
jgi:hypothetical protein